MLSNFPDELLLNIAVCLPEPDLNAVAQTARRFFPLFDLCLYRRNAPSGVALWWAAKHNQVPTAQKAIDAGATGGCQLPSSQDERGHKKHCGCMSARLPAALKLLGCDRRQCEPLRLAATNGSDGVIRLLSEMPSVDVGHRGWFRNTPVFSALHQNHLSTVKLLLDLDDVDPNAVDYRGFSLLFYAALRGQVELTGLFLTHYRFKPDLACFTKRTPLSYAAGSGQESTAGLLLATGNVDPDSKDKRGKTPFAWAVEQGQLGTARLLLETGRVDPNCRFFLNCSLRYPADWTPLNCVIRGDTRAPTEEVINMLVEHQGVDLNAMSAGDSPLAHAIKRDKVALVMKLMASGRVDPNAPGVGGMTALHTAARHGRVDSVKVLLKHDNVDCSARCARGFTPLGTAARRRNGAVIKVLLRSGRFTDANCRCGDSGGTPLWWAASWGRIAAVRSLLFDGGKAVDVHAADDNGSTPVDIARARGFMRVVRILEKGSLRAGPVPPRPAKIGILESSEEDVLGELFNLELG